MMHNAREWRQVPYWWEMPGGYNDNLNPNLNDNGNGNDRDKGIVGLIVAVAIALALCSALGSCGSSKKVIDNKETREERVETRDERKDSLRMEIKNTTVEGTKVDMEDWYDWHIVETVWSEPDSMGKQYMVSQKTMDKHGGSKQVKEDSVRNEGNVVMESGSVVDKETKTETKIKTETKTKTETKVGSGDWWLSFGIGLVGAVMFLGVVWYMYTCVKRRGILTGKEGEVTEE